jgi:uncharacterized protein with HEPN domain
VSERDATYLVHIERAVDAIDAYLSGVTEEVFGRTPMIRDAVVRNLEIISEASRRLSDEMKERHPRVQWKAIAAAGNRYRHEYDFVDHSLVWFTATDGLIPLRRLLATEERPIDG